MWSLIVTFIVSIAVFVLFLFQQRKYFLDTKKHREIFEHFFDKSEEYTAIIADEDGEQYPQLYPVGTEGSDLNSLIQEINTYLYKTKGTSDYEFIRSKVERKLSMRYDQASVHQSFPTYLGLMGTFTGVFIGILFFLLGFVGADNIIDLGSDGADNIIDAPIKNLLLGVLVSMSTSLVGLIMTTINTAKAGEARKKVEDDKNEFFDFIQTDVTKTASASLVSAISKLHDTVDKFEPAFTKVIDGFKEAFADCTKAFGDDFKQNVSAVTSAVEVMGKNMDKINDNISLQKKVLDTLKTNEIARGMEKYVEAANHFVGITQSLDKFEEARRMMLVAAQEAINIQNQYTESLKIPREVAVKIAGILDRVSTFENSVNELGDKLRNREILGNDVLEMVKVQINSIAKKSKIAEKFIEIADAKLELAYQDQVKAIGQLNQRYLHAIEGHSEGFKQMMSDQTNDLKKRHDEFIEIVQTKFNVEDIREEFTNLHKLVEIAEKLGVLSTSVVKSGDVRNIGDSMVKPSDLKRLEENLGKRLAAVESELKKIDDSSRRGSFFSGFSRRQNDGQ